MKDDIQRLKDARMFFQMNQSLDPEHAHFYAIDDAMDRLEAKPTIAAQARAHEIAQEVINRGVDIMTDEQLGQWEGVRTFQEQPLDSYTPAACTNCERLREALDELYAQAEASTTDRMACGQLYASFIMDVIREARSALPPKPSGRDEEAT